VTIIFTKSEPYFSISLNSYILIYSLTQARPIVIITLTTKE